MRNGTSTGPCSWGALMLLSTVIAAAVGCVGTVGSRPSASGAGASTGTGNSAGPGTGGAGPGTGGGNASGVGGSGVPMPSACGQIGDDVSPSVMRRLSNLEYQLTLQDLFQLSAPPSIEGLPPDVDKDGFRTFAALQTVTAQHLRGYIDRAHALADELLADSTRRPKVLGCEPTASGCLRGFVTRFGKLAYRRPLETAELDAVTTRATADALDTTDQFRFAIELLLASPSFLFRTEVGNTPEALSTLSSYELAGRLSFALWGRAPDAALLDKAAQGGLDSADGLAATATTMLADARARTFFDAFFRQWLGFEGMQAPPNPPTGWSESLLADMTRETQSVVGDFAWGGKSFFDVLTANYTRPTAALSSYFGLPTAASDGSATFPASHPRANTGLLTHPALLAAKRDGDLIAIRGNWLRRTFLCRPLGIPSDVAEMLGDLLVGLTRVEIVQKRNTELACKGCHAAIDPVGMGFVQFDHTGRYDGTVDAAAFGVASALPDAADPAFSSVAGLAAKLQAMPEVTACLADKVFVYTNGRDPARADSCALDGAATAFTAGGRTFPALLTGLVGDPTFRLRRATAGSP